MPTPETPDYGVLITVVKGDRSNAARHGIKENDILLSYNGVSLRNGLRDYDRLRSDAATHKRTEKDSVPVQVWRAGRVIELRVDPGELGVKMSRDPPALALQGARHDADRSDPGVL